MKPFVPIVLILLLAFFLGVFSVNARDSSTLAQADPWGATEVPGREWQKGALERLAKNDRWEVELETMQSSKVQVDDLGALFRLIAVINSDAKYSVLQSKAPEGQVLRLAEGDMINLNWTIQEIGNGKIIATFNGLEQALELFPGN
ncbi:MAG TPA: hypothetical protein EYQ14_23050 [Gammaproteobacteria bacterium]|nr:hypothetical protein [Gammaproteobacteria bacterium]